MIINSCVTNIMWSFEVVPLLLDGQVLLQILPVQMVREDVQECQLLSRGVAGEIEIVILLYPCMCIRAYACSM